ncbi:hypothetical protein A2U01_0108684, partial [Trifolium medium]|nr:hypothetical protein [Trifolium medium]
GEVRLRTASGDDREEVPAVRERVDGDSFGVSGGFSFSLFFFFFDLFCFSFRFCL